MLVYCSFITNAHAQTHTLLHPLTPLVIKAYATSPQRHKQTHISSHALTTPHTHTPLKPLRGQHNMRHRAELLSDDDPQSKYQHMNSSHSLHSMLRAFLLYPTPQDFSPAGSGSADVLMNIEYNMFSYWTHHIFGWVCVCLRVCVCAVVTHHSFELCTRMCLHLW